MRHRPPAPSPLFLPRLLVVATLLLSGGCRAADGPAEPAAGTTTPLLHLPVPAAAELQPAEPVLWVALAAHLGPAVAAASSNGDVGAAPPLKLRAASGAVTLIDASGQRFMAPELVLHWQRRPLAAPVQVRRQAIGPFASYESADQAAARLRALGMEVRIARPRDWEVWVPADARLPVGTDGTLVEQRLTERLALTLRRAAGVVELEGPIRLLAPGGLRWGEGVYGGPFRLLADAHGGWSLVEEVPLERYLEGVLPHEIGAGAPGAALEVQGVLARTWAVRNRHRFEVDGYHLCADTQCQVYRDPRQAGDPVRRAIAASRHRVLTWENEPIHAVYHASNGGMAAGFEEGWNGAPLPYLRPFADGPAPFAKRLPVPVAPASLAKLLQDGSQAYGADHPLFRWQRRLTAGQIGAALGGDAAAIGAVRNLRVRERGASGRVVALEIQGSQGTRLLRMDAIRRTLRSLPSTMFTVQAEGAGVWLVQGGGFGHGAGLSQAGAIDLARRGWTTPKILQHYYPGTALQPLGGPEHAP
ncbi:MAG: SpoIID/LytB domain-containing protein [Cyanobacteriota bacterium]